MRIGELAKRADVSRDTIRFYERSGLIRSDPSRAATNTYRNYPDDTVITIQTIQEAQAAGLTLEDLRVLLRAFDAADNDTLDGEAFLAAKIAEVEATIERSQRFLKTLRDAQTALARAVTVAPPPDQ